MDFLIVILLALLGSCLSFFCGFGLGTLLLAAFLLYFPPEVAIAAAAVVHMLNNIFKLVLVGRHADMSIVRSFGALSVIGALLGALCLGWIGHIGDLGHYHILGHTLYINGMNFTIGILIVGFAFLEILPRFKAIMIARPWLPVGGLLSGFFGGLTGQQGALRSAFLMKAGLTKEAFIGTRVVCACLVDLTRLAVYGAIIGMAWMHANLYLVSAATLAAFTGAWLGNKWVKKMELAILNYIITAALVVFGILLASGMIG